MSHSYQGLAYLQQYLTLLWFSLWLLALSDVKMHLFVNVSDPPTRI
jgi:hypothetical protein